MAKALMPGGVSSPVRAIKPYPFYTEQAQGAHLKTVDGRELIDCCLAYGPMILGHAHPAVRKAIAEQLERGWLYGTLTARTCVCEDDHQRPPGHDDDPVRLERLGSDHGRDPARPRVHREAGYRQDRGRVPRRPRCGARESGSQPRWAYRTRPCADVVAHTRQVPYNDPEALESLLSQNNDIAAFILKRFSATSAQSCRRTTTSMKSGPSRKPMTCS